jgi:TonB family protein
MRRLFTIVFAAVFYCPGTPICSAEPLPQTAVAAVPEYPDSPEGIETFAEDIFKALRAKDEAKLSVYFSDLTLPDHQAWFARVFGAEEGARLAARYGELLPQLPSNARSSFESALSSSRTTPEVRAFNRSLAPTGTGLDWAFVEATTEEVHLYTVTGTNASQQYGFFVGRFVYVDGGFRYITDRVLRALSTAPALRIRVGGAVQQAKLVQQVSPAYPTDARASRTQGVISLHVVIGTDGSMKQVDVVRGDPLLAKAAVDAVKQWRYQPTLLEGDPVEVDTMIDITFRL